MGREIGACSLVAYGLPLHQVKACEALEALDELLESDLPIITPHLSEVLMFCLEVSQGLPPVLVLLGVFLLVPDFC